jgi:hypothetical protein
MQTLDAVPSRAHASRTGRGALHVDSRYHQQNVAVAAPTALQIEEACKQSNYLSCYDIYDRSTRGKDSHYLVSAFRNCRETPRSCL